MQSNHMCYFKFDYNFLNYFHFFIVLNLLSVVVVRVMKEMPCILFAFCHQNEMNLVFEDVGQSLITESIKLFGYCSTNFQNYYADFLDSNFSVSAITTSEDSFNSLQNLHNAIAKKCQEDNQELVDFLFDTCLFRKITNVRGNERSLIIPMPANELVKHLNFDEKTYILQQNDYANHLIARQIELPFSGLPYLCLS